LGEAGGDKSRRYKQNLTQWVEAEFIREVDPGEVVVVNSEGVTSFRPFKPSKTSHCIFEFIYFARPDSHIFGRDVYSVRKAFGKQLAKESNVEADVVIAVPDSGIVAAMGYAQKAKVPFEMGLVRNHYVGRTFIQPSASVRDLGVRLKLNPVSEILKNKSVVVVDDSIVRGTTSKLRTRALRQAGAREIHMRISCPPIRFPCFYGIDFSSKGELIACTHTVEGIGEFIGADSLKYLSLEGMFKAMPFPAKHFCTACFTGKYPVDIPDEFTKTCLEPNLNQTIQTG
jgi:amidophosphoribosyltransferase